ncbi:MAG: chemotaxis response regulator protein-glutamate methylesterase [Pseudomonadota bacterium]
MDTVQKVLVVDDSGFFRRRIIDIIEKDSRFTVVGFAANGLEAIAKTKLLNPDIITMDQEMPGMDGIAATKAILAIRSIPILMLSSLTFQGARTTLDALEAGVVDFLPKNSEHSPSSTTLDFALIQKLEQLIHSRPKLNFTNYASMANQRISSFTATNSAYKDSEKIQPSISSRKIQKTTNNFHPQIIVIGASTGGPIAVQRIAESLSKPCNVPILIVQHMPALFTGPYALRLGSRCELPVQEAKDGEFLQAGHVYVAPGGKQLKLNTHGKKISIEEDESQLYRPSVDETLLSANDHYAGAVLAIILTGMGSDGRVGAQKLREKGSKILIQDEASCVVFGMPQAVMKVGAYDEILSLEDIGERICAFYKN